MNHLSIRPISDMDIISENDDELSIMIVGSDCDGAILDHRMANLFAEIESVKGLDYDRPIHIADIDSFINWDNFRYGATIIFV